MNANGLQSFENLAEKLVSLSETKKNLEAEVVFLYLQQMILEELEKPEEEMLTEKLTEEESALSEELLTAAMSFYRETLSKVETTKEALLEASNRHKCAVNELSKKKGLLQAKYEDFHSTLQEGGSLNRNNLNTANNKLSSEMVLFLLKTTEEERQLLEERKSRLQQLHQLSNHSAISVEVENDSELRLKILREKLSKLEHLSGLKCEIINESTVTLQFVDPHLQMPENSNLVFTFHFESDDAQCLELSSVKANLKIIEVDSIIQNVENYKDLPRLVNSLRKVWVLLAEISTLRERHAVDWRPEERTFYLMIDKLVCTLHVPILYPRDSITLEQIIGGSDNQTLQNMSNPEDVSLTGWVNHLQELL